MVFYEIDSITDVENGYRIIIYYIKGKSDHQDQNNTVLFKTTEAALELLGKKNDDIFIIEITHNSYHFRQFVDLYRPEIIGPITLFAVNNEGIPLISENICEEMTIFNAIEKLSTACNLKEIPKLGQHFVETKRKETILEHYKLFSDGIEELSTSQESLKAAGSPLTFSSDSKEDVLHKPLHTMLHIRLPNGVKEELQFDNDSTLQEVWVTISIKCNIKDFDLKTYYHPIFSKEDYAQTLEHLNLCPRGVLIVVNKNVMTLNNNGRVSAIIQSGFYRFINLPIFVFQYMRGILFVFWNYVFPSNNSSTFRRQERKEIKLSDNSNPSSSQGTSRRYVSKNIGSNIHTLYRNDDSDDENNRYNGNSTQQK